MSRKERFGCLAFFVVVVLAVASMLLGSPGVPVLAQTTPTVEVDLPFVWDGANQAFNNFLQNELVMVGLYVIVGLGLGAFALRVLKKAFA